MSQAERHSQGTSGSAADADSFDDGFASEKQAVEVKRLDDRGDTASEQSSLDGAAAKGKEAISTAKDKATDMSDQARDKVADVSSQAHAKADEGMNKAAEGVSQAADMLRQRGEQSGGSVGTAATTVADKLDSTGSYLREKDTDQLMSDLEALIRRKPVESLLVAAGAGFVLSKIFS